MLKIQANPSLKFRADDFGMQFVGTTLEAPQDVADFLYRLGVRNAELLIPMIRSMPSAFIHEFNLSSEGLKHAQDTLQGELVRHGVTIVERQAPKRHFGAMPPPGAVRKIP